MAETVWGVDVGLSRTTICVLGHAIHKGRTVGLATQLPRLSPLFHRIDTEPGSDIPARLLDLREAVKNAAVLLSVQTPPLFVFVERPTGRFPNPHLNWAVGVVTEALYAALRDLFPHPTSVWHVPVTTWKKEVVGRGDASKQAVMDWARRAHVIPDSFDLDSDTADALAIASYAALQVPGRKAA